LLLPALGMEGMHTWVEVHDDDVDPLVDLEVSLVVKRVRRLECEQGNTSFFVRARIDGTAYQSPETDSVMDTAPEWVLTHDVDDSKTAIAVILELWRNENGREVPCDIAGTPGEPDDGTTLHLTYTTTRGEWSGDDALGDADGYGHASGASDGVCTADDCEVWFALVQNDFDGDGLTYWEEVNVYGTDPAVDDIGRDDDGDGVPLEWEDFWGYDPTVFEPHEHLDPDGDGLYNTEEWRTAEWLSDPFYRDVFVEVDWMAGPTALSRPYRMPFLSKQYLFSAFSRHFIALHLDDGCMGGGEQIPYSNLSDPSLRTIYNRYFLHGIVNRWRQGIFHYAVLCGVNPWRRDVGGFNFQQDGFVVCVGTIRLYRLLEPARTVATASLFMHELGHNIGLFHSDWEGIDNSSCNFPWRKGWYVYEDYRSCMNYRYAWHLIDYSNGKNGAVDYDDWSHLNFHHFKN
jgi:hypothetical protein